MKLVLTLVVRNEEDVIADNVAFHLARGVDHVIVTDHRSTDATCARVERFVRDGRATLLRETSDGFDQGRWVSEMARTAATALCADWVINADADELWSPAHGDLKDALSAIGPEYGGVVVPRVNFLPLREPGAAPLRSMVWRDVSSVNALGNPLPGKAAHRAVADVDVQDGNHGASSPSLGPLLATDALVVLHYPYRSYRQFAARAIDGAAAVGRTPGLPQHVGRRWRYLAQLHADGTLRAWYDALPHADDPDLARRAAAGDVVRDESAARVLRGLPAG